MKARRSPTVSVLVAALFMTGATLGPVSSKVYADTNPQGKNAKVAKAVTIMPVKPMPTPPVCGRGVDQNYVFNFKTPEHYQYEVKSQKLVSGTSFPANEQTITITAVPDSGYTFGKAIASWDYTLARA